MISHIRFILCVILAICALNFSMYGFIFSAAPSPIQAAVFSAVFSLLIACATTLLLLFRPLAKPLAWLLLAALSLCAYFRAQFGVFLDTAMLENALATDANEVADLLSLPLVLTCAVGIFGTAALLWRLQLKKSKFAYRLALCALFFALLCASIAASSRALIPFLRSHDAVRFLNMPFYQFYAANKLFWRWLQPPKPRIAIALDACRAGFCPPAEHDAGGFSALANSTPAPKQNPVFSQNLAKTPAPSENPVFSQNLAAGSDGRLFVLIVGETARAANYSAAGYARNATNAYTAALPLAFLREFSSCGTATATSLPCMFSPHARTEFSRSERELGALSVLRRFAKVFWIDNNSGGCKGVCEGVENLQDYRGHDGWLADALEAALERSAPYLRAGGDVLAVLHIQGSHGPSYFKRYPADFERFKPACKSANLSSCSAAELINAYDNSLLYTDALVARAYELAAAAPARHFALLYLSDHGESLGERGVYLHGLPYALAPREQKHIPAQIYARHGEQAVDFSPLAQRPLSQDNLFHSLLGFFGVQTALYDEQLDIFALAKAASGAAKGGERDKE